MDSRDSRDSDAWNYGVNLSHSLVIWNRGVGVMVMWSPGIVGDSVVAVADTAAHNSAQSSSRRSLRSVINRTLQNLSLVIVLKIFAPNLNRYALTYCNRNVPEMKTVSQEIRLFSFSCRRMNLNDELYALRSNQTVLQKSAGQRISRDVIDVQPVVNIYVVSDVCRSVILMI